MDFYLPRKVYTVIEITVEIKHSVEVPTRRTEPLRERSV
jgi:hypothetical protein